MQEIDEFTTAYIEAALFTTTDNSDESGGEPLDKNYNEDDISPEAMATIIEDCRKFQEENEEDINVWDDGGRYSADEMAGHDFWLTRNGHGSGFWDGDWGDEIGDRLTEASKAYGECNLYVGDDGKLYLM
jgi:hypothetical protein